MIISGLESKLLSSNFTFKQAGMTQTLLELIKPLNASQALVKLADQSEITLSIKTPLEADKLYYATLVKEGENYLLKSLQDIPKVLLKLLQKPSMMDLPALLTQLSKGKSPHAILFEHLTQNMLHTNSKEQLQQNLDQLLVLIAHQTPTFIVDYQDHTGYIKFSDKKLAFREKVVKFEAFFMSLGPIQGQISFIKNQKKATIYTASDLSRQRLIEAKSALALSVEIKKIETIALEKPKFTLLDIKG